MEKKGKLELTWVGKYEEEKLEPRILIEDKSKSYGDQNTENMLIHGDNLLALKALEKDFAGKVKCVYLDPPYNIDAANEHYDDNVENSAWLSIMKNRLSVIKNLLAEDGVILVQIDKEQSAYLKVLMDEVFGENNFQNEIIWTYRRWSNSRKGLLTAHQTIFFYSKSNSFSFNYEYGEYSPTTNLDQILQERERNDGGKSIYKRGDDGTVVLAKEKKGVPISDVGESQY